MNIYLKIINMILFIKVECRTVNHQLFIYDAKDAHRPLHVIYLLQSHGGPTKSNSKMFCLDSMPLDAALHLHHNAQHLYFEASSERGRDDWLACGLTSSFRAVLWTTGSSEKSSVLRKCATVMSAIA